jgi:DNA-binding transcriptional LysR family regulator
MIRLRQLQALEYVLSNRTLTRAAELFGVTQPAMTRLIAQLEEDVGCKLLHRDQGRFQLTAQGTVFYDAASRVLNAARQLEGVAQSLREDSEGSIRIISSYGLIGSLIHRALATFVADYPAVKISMDTMRRPALEEAVHNGKFDIALATLPVRAPALCAIETLAAFPLVCIVPKQHALASRKFIEAHQLENEPFISERPETLLRSRVDGVFNKLNVKRRMQLECHNTEVICDMVAAGLGVSIVPPFVKGADNDRFLRKRFKPEIMMEYAMITAPKGEISRHAQILMERIATSATKLAS